MSLKRLVLKNWQPHHHLVVDLTDITVLVGDNFAGKSSVLRALRWLVFNEWDGRADEYITHGEEECEVSLEFDDHVLSRKKTPSLNQYTLDGEDYRAFGRGVPEEITKTLCLSPDSIQNQMDPAFWLSLNSGQAASALNEIFNLSTIDRVTTNIAGELRKARTRVTISRERLLVAKKVKKDLDWTVQADKDLKKIETLFLKLEKTKEEIERLTIIKQDWEECQNLLDKGNKAVEEAEKVIDVGETLLELSAKIILLKRLVEAMQGVDKWKEELQKEEAKLKVILVGKCPLCGHKPSSYF